MVMIVLMIILMNMMMMMIACYPSRSDHILFLLCLRHQTLELLVYPVEPVLKTFHFKDCSTQREQHPVKRSRHLGVI